MDHDLELIIPDPGNIWKFDFFYIFPYPGNTGNLIFFNFLLSWQRAAGGRLQGLGSVGLGYFWNMFPVKMNMVTLELSSKQALF